jgi:hypothetical protein
MRCGHVLEECPSIHNIAGITSGCDYCQEQPLSLAMLLSAIGCDMYGPPQDCKRNRQEEDK